MGVNLADYARQPLRDLLAQCSEKSQARFHKIFPRGIDAMDEDTIKGVIALVQRTIKHEAKEPPDA